MNTLLYREQREINYVLWVLLNKPCALLYDVYSTTHQFHLYVALWEADSTVKRISVTDCRLGHKIREMNDIEDKKEISNKDIYNLLKGVIEANNELKKQIHENTSTVRKEIKENCETVSHELQALKRDIAEEFLKLKKESDDLNKENEVLKQQLNAVDRKLRKYNLVIYNLREDTSIEDNHNVINLFKDSLGIPCCTSDLRDCYRIGAQEQGKIRPIVIEAARYQLKADVFTNVSKLKGSGIVIANDLTYADYQDRKVLYTTQKLARNLGLNAQIKNNKLKIDTEIFTPEELRKYTPSQITQELQGIQHKRQEGDRIQNSPREEIQIKAKTRQDYHQWKK
nr:unnamed protein product [Callosobruchus analis]